MGNALDSKKSSKSIFSVGQKQETLCGQLSYRTRIIGWLSCSITGLLLSMILTFLFVFAGLDVVIYAVLYSLLQCLNIAGSCFLSTPEGHCKAMKKKESLIPSIVYITCIILTIVIALATGIRWLVLLFVFLQTFAYYWYTISFIPYGQKIIKNLCKSCFG